MSNEVGSKQPLTVPPQRSGQAQGILSISRDAEVLQSFLRVDLGLDDEGDAAPKRVLSEEISPPPQSRPQEGVMERREREKARLNKVPSNRTKVGKTTFSQLTKDIKLKQGGEGGKKKKKGGGSKAARIRLQEEVYTDKDRAAAVVMGSRDIKQSLKMKRKQDRSLALQIPEEAEPGTLLALGSREMRSGDVSIAINFMHKALELNPNDKNALVARSKCYLLLGEPNLALKDAETALQGDKTFIRGLFQKAESLYHLGDFEHSLMYYHRGLRIRPELEGFRLGVQKAQEAIENTIGSKTVTQHKSQSLPQSQSTAIAPLTTEEPLVAESKKQTLEAGSLSKTSRPVSNVGQKTSKSLLGELCVDKEYLEQLLRHPDIKCLHQQKASNNIAMFAEEGVAFLNNRQEFWRQQRPSTASSKKMIKKSPHATTNNTRLAC